VGQAHARAAGTVLAGKTSKPPDRILIRSKSEKNRKQSLPLFRFFKKSFFDKFSPKANYFLGLVSGILVLIVVGFFVLLFVFLGDDSPKPAKTVSNAGGTGTQPSQPQKMSAKGYFVNLASDMGLDIDQFQSCVDSGKYRQKVQDDYQAGVDAGVRGTPATFVNGQMVSGAVPYDQLKVAVDNALAGQEGPTSFDISDADPIRGELDAPVTVVF